MPSLKYIKTSTVNSYGLISGNNSNNKSKKKVTKKGILLTALLVAGIIGASFLVYLVPR
ncbi:MAG: hypothetical protein WCF03_14955 [Nitrososphaeraceae archaeon]|jgi:hypothetical protein